MERDCTRAAFLSNMNKYDQNKKTEARSNRIFLLRRIIAILKKLGLANSPAY